MQGCRWQEKSFSVSTSVKEADVCICGKPIYGTVYKYNGDNLCKDCFSGKPNLASGVSDFHTHKDKLYEFDYPWYDKEVPIRSKGQWNKFMKEKKLHDDVKVGVRTNKTPAPVHSRQEMLDTVMKGIQERGLYDRFKSECKNLNRALKERRY